MTTWIVFCVCFIILLGIAQATVPRYLPPTSITDKTLLTVEYFQKGFKIYEIVAFLLTRHGIITSLRTVKRILKRLNLKRRNIIYTPLEIVSDVINREIQTSGQCIGYRTMWRRLMLDYNMYVKRDDVMEIMRALDPVGVELRKAHRLRRRVYFAKGPNFVWHIDGYDKLKPYGFCIHGAVDGFSRKIIWLEVSDSNNDPRLIARYFLDALNEHKKVPRILRSDGGTENCIALLLQQYFRHDATDPFAGARSVVVGKSTSNQRIERWWGTLRQNGIHWWINFFKDLRDTGTFNELDAIQCENLKFCFMDLIQTELDRIAQQWNVHEIREQTNSSVIGGKPDTLFFIPGLFETHDFGNAANLNDVNVCKDMYSRPKRHCEEFKELAHLLKPDLQMPLDAESALRLYTELNNLISRID